GSPDWVIDPGAADRLWNLSSGADRSEVEESAAASDGDGEGEGHVAGATPRKGAGNAQCHAAALAGSAAATRRRGTQALRGGFEALFANECRREDALSRRAYRSEGKDAAAIRAA